MGPRLPPAGSSPRETAYALGLQNEEFAQSPLLSVRVAPLPEFPVSGAELPKIAVPIAD